ncbi:MAG: peroxide stress protein YaaA [Tissierellia bacterium]|nr:peroxide stress protein YaaA [Tissierellia bacterium]
MKVIISPAKKMVEDQSLAPEGQPLFLDRTREILQVLKTMDYGDLKALWGTSEKLSQLNYRRVQEMDLDRGLSPAILAFEGIQYQYMAPGVLEGEDLAYIQDHVRILSGFYGVLRPFDGVRPYRLEMQARLRLGQAQDLYDFWGDRIYQALMGGGEALVNLASLEYARVIKDYLQEGDLFITPLFGAYEGGRFKQKATYAKMARGEMVRFMAQEKIEDPEDLKAFKRLGYSYDDQGSSQDTWLFVRG